jgi:hypothetical protein
MAIVHPAFCVVVGDSMELFAHACSRYETQASRIQNISKTACTAQEPLTYFRAQSTPPDNKKIEREQP